MQKTGDENYLFSASDLVHFLGCNHSTVLDLRSFSEKVTKAQDSASNKLLQNKGFQHEAAYLQALKDEGKQIIEIPKDMPLAERARQTRVALESGVDVVFQGVLYSHPWRGDADFLIKVDTPSALGNHSYEVVDTKLARSPEPKHVIQLCVYADLLGDVQGQTPRNVHLVLGSGEQVTLNVNDFLYYYRHAKRRFEAHVATPPANSHPEPCQHCQFCSWNELCGNQWQQDDHLSLVANIQRSQIDKLRTAGVSTVAALADLGANTQIPDLNPEVFGRLRAQAGLQKHKLQTGENKLEIISYPPGRGFERMPAPEVGDLFFDMEGDPLHPNGLEYLFGVYYLKDDALAFRAFWAHSHDEERETFKEFMAFLDVHMKAHPNAHIYHYNHYETTALKRLACRYAIAEEQLDNLLRRQKFVDLYKVVRESVRVSEPGYSIKNMEAFYMDKRDGAVATAGDSIVVYNEWRETQDPALLKQLADYNEIDCISTQKLRDWLLGLKPSESAWFDGSNGADQQEAPERKDWEVEYERCQQQLLDRSPESEKDLRIHLAHLLEFHNREAKPQWWASFERQDKFEDEIIADTECLGGLTSHGNPMPEKRSLIYTYRFPPQEYKLRPGDTVVNIETMETAGTVFELDENSGIISIKRGNGKEPLPNRFSIGPTGPVATPGIRAAIYRVAADVIAANGNYRAVRDFLNKSTPRLTGRAAGTPIVASLDISEITNAIAALDDSYLFVQGPPGAGKTFTSAHVIVELMRMGKKVGIAANSHKAIHNLLDKVEEVAQEKDFRFAGVKKSSAGNSETAYEGRCIRSEDKTDSINLGAQLLAGTAWLFSDERFNGHLDYLFIDEAGQVSVANVVAMGTATKNIILVGDQMQLGQPIQGIHPGDAGLSILDFLLGGHATIPPARGIFLSNTRRLHPTICSFISDAFYDGRLAAHPENERRRLIIEEAGDAVQEGIRLLPVEHVGCSQKSTEEAAIIREKYLGFLGQRFQDKDGTMREITSDDILVVSPYNVQVNHLKSVLPAGAKVGTVDKFQGQEAPIVLISIVTSSAEDLPRNVEFLYSKNRLNVALSRAQCLAMIVVNPLLLEVPCKTIAQMKLVNTFCWLDQYTSMPSETLLEAA